MNAQSKKLTQLAASILFAMSCGATIAGDVINLEQAGSDNGTGNFANIEAKGSNNNTVSIYQAGTGTGVIAGDPAAEKNQVGVSGSSLKIEGDGGVQAYIGQGGYYDGSWNASRATKSNIVKGTLSTGAQVRTSQNASGGAGAAQNVIDLNITGAGLVTVNQGEAAANSSSAAVTSFSATVRRDAAGGAIIINQGSGAGSTATTGTANVRHAGGTHTVTITQDASNNNTDMGTVETYTQGEGGTLDITQSNSGKVYVTSTGDTGGDAATISGTATINNSGTGTVGLMGVTTGNVVDVYAKGTGILTVDNSKLNSSGNGVYVNKLGTPDGGSLDNASTLGGVLNVTMGGTNNTVFVKDYAGGTTNVVVDPVTSGVTGSKLTLSGTNLVASTATINQMGSFQDATVISANGSTGTFNLKEVGGASDNMTTVNLTY